MPVDELRGYYLPEEELEHFGELEGYGYDGQRYWCAEKPDTLWKDAKGRTTDFYRDFQNSPFSQSISRNWLYYHGVYKGFEEFNLLDGAIQRFGEQGEMSFMQMNHFRNLIHHLYVLTTRDRPAPQTRATSDDNESLIAAEIGDGLLERYLRDLRFENNLNRATEEALVLTAGFVGLDWDEGQGAAVRGDLQRNRIIHQGDARVHNPSLLDIAYDQEVYEWSKLPWIIEREFVNKWDLAAQYPHRAREIMISRDPEDTTWHLIQMQYKSDQISKYTFWHKRTPALQSGRKMVYVDGAWLEDGPLPDWFETIPIFRISPSDVLLTTLGYSPAFDLQGPQEALNMTISSALTNLDTFGVQSIWTPPGNTLSAGMLSPGLRLLQSKAKPEALQLTHNPQDIYKFMELLVGWMELISGVNSVTRGQPEASLKSGVALSLVEQKALQYANQLIRAYYQLFEDFCTFLIRMLTYKMQSGERRVLQRVGRFGRAQIQHYGRPNLEKIDRVVVDSGNPMSKTLAGRWDMAEMLTSKGLVKTPEEIMHLLTTGRVEPLYQANQSELARLAAERDALLEGKLVPVLKGDNHPLDIREHFALLNTPAVRADQRLMANVLGHVLVHHLMLYLPDVHDLLAMQNIAIPQLPSMFPSPGIFEQIPPEQMASSLTPQDLAMLQPQQGVTPMPLPAQPPGAPGQPSGPTTPSARKKPPPERGPQPSGPIEQRAAMTVPGGM